MPGGAVAMRFFGAAEVAVGGEPVAMHSRRSMAVLAFLAISGGRHARASLAATFWEDAPEGLARANLRSVLSTLQSRVPGALDVSREMVAFNELAGVGLDVAQFVELVVAAEDEASSDADRIDACRRALELYRGELLAGFEQLGITALTNWVETERNVLRRRAVRAAALLVDLLMLEKQPAEASHAAARLVALDEYREASYLVSMRSLLANGEPQQALAEFSRCHSRVVGELGVALGPEITALERAIRGETAAPASTRPVISRMGGLPTPRALFGRDELIEQLATSGRETAGGLITLCGPAGVGKTSLAVAVAHRWREQGHDVVFVDATNASNGRQLAGTLGNAVGAQVPPGNGDDDLAAVCDLLAGRAVRIVLDNIEQVDGAPSVISELLTRGASLLVLATSRLPMRIAAESVQIVPSLELPTADQVATEPTLGPEQGDDNRLDALKRLACVQLFQHRAVISGTAPASSALELRIVGRICRLLDGLPLAIELVATRRRMMGLAEIEASLREGFATGDLSMIDGGFRDAPERHRGLRAALASTIALLDPESQALFANASVFEGPFTFDAIAAVCAGEQHDRGRVLRCVQALIDLHLFRREEHNGRVWFDMLNSVRALATSLLAEAGRTGGIRERRIGHDCGLIELAADEFFSSSNTDWFRYLDQYMSTLRTTLDELHDRRDPRELAIVTWLAPYWFDRGRVAEAHHRLLGARTASPDPDRPWLSALNRLWCAGMRAESVGYGTAAGTLGEIDDALADVRATAPPAAVELEALHLALHVHVLDHTACLDVARTLVEQGVALASAAGQPWFRTEFVYSRGVIDHLTGDDERAADHFRAAVTDAELHGNKRVALYGLMMLEMIGAPGRDGAATANLAELLDLAIELGDHRQTIWLTMILGSLAAHEGDLTTAAAYYLDALALSRDPDYFVGVGCCLMAGAGIGVMRNDLAEAVRFHACVAPDLESLGRSMPQSNLEVYRYLTDPLRREADADPLLAAAWSQGSVEPRSTALTALAAYLTHVRNQGATVGSSSPAVPRHDRASASSSR
jgi:predicted ATPase/DNA-binding SARP family transcriptional activator